MNKPYLIIGIFITLLSSCTTTMTQVELQTTEGTITLTLAADMPITTKNFVDLVNKGYYDNILFHRVINGFMIQGGDPTGTGRGGPGYTILDEFTGSDLDKNLRGTVSMANAGPNTGGSQFFLNLLDNNFLDGKHPVFGRVVEGMDVVDKIAQVKTDGDPPIGNNRPLKEVKII